MIITGEITDKEIIEKDDYTRCVYVIDSKKYSTFEPEIFNKFQKGDFVEVDLVKKEGSKFWNMVSMKTIDKEKVAQNGSKGEIHLTIESVRIGALNCAIEWRKTLKIEEQEKINLFQAAAKFEDYILHGVK